MEFRGHGVPGNLTIARRWGSLQSPEGHADIHAKLQAAPALLHARVPPRNVVVCSLPRSFRLRA
jgi:hypothetical protein